MHKDTTIGILSKSVCPSTEKVIDYFIEHGAKIDLVIIETGIRRKFSKNEIVFRKAHDNFNRITKKYSFIRRLARLMWDHLPEKQRYDIEKNIYHIPVINNFSVKKFCEKRDIATVEVEKHSSRETVEILQERKIEYLLMISSHWLLKPPLVSYERTKIINAHSGWLPKHKGLDSIAWSLKEGDPVGITTHIIDEGIDSGPLLKFYPVEITQRDDLLSIINKVSALQPYAFYDTIDKMEKGELSPVNQESVYPPHVPMTLEELMSIHNELKRNNVAD